MTNEIFMEKQEKSLSQMIADVLNTNTRTVHFLMLLGAIVYFGSRQK